MNSKPNPTLKSCRVKPLKVAITLGDPSGIGPRTCAKALEKSGAIADFIVIGSRFVYDLANSQQPPAPRPRFIDMDNVRHKSFCFGRLKAEYGRASLEYLDQALDLLSTGEVDCLVTAPVSKEAVTLSGTKGFKGHTEYIAAKTRTLDFAMMLLNRYLKFCLLTRHLSLRNVPGKIRAEDLENVIRLSGSALKKLFGISRPRLVVLALNPHASDGGLFGNEESGVIIPSLRKIKDKSLLLSGPLAADAAVAMLNNGDYDCGIAMYHDQAMIPLKLTGASSGVNLTLGLPFVRTSPLHGTAFDIAANPRAADPSSFVAAIKLAVKCASNLKKD